MNLRVYDRNLLGEFNFTNGGAGPAKSEDPDFPMQNMRRFSRFRFWRSAIGVSNPYDVEWAFATPQTFQTFGLTNIRAYRGTAGITSLEVFYSASAYPPGAWTQILAPQAISTTDNDKLYDIAPTAVRSLRFRLANAGQFSCRPWAVLQSDVIDLGSEGFDMVEGLQRTRAPDVRAFLGGINFYDLGVGKAAVLRDWRFKLVATVAQRDALLALQRRTLMFRDYDGNHFEVTVKNPLVRWGRSGVLVTTRSHVEVSLQQVP